MRWLFRRRATRSNAATGRRRRRFRCVPARCRRCRRLPISRARSALPARAIPKPPKRKSPSSAELHDKLKDAYWSGQVDIQRQVASAWMLYAEGKHDDALKAMSAAADAEDKTEKHPVTPGAPKPARELYGEMLLESGQAQGSARRLRSDAEEGAEPARRLCRRGQGRRKVRRQGQGARIFRKGRRDRRRRRQDPHRGRRRARVPKNRR